VLIVQGGVTSGPGQRGRRRGIPGPGSVFLDVDWSFRAPVRPGEEFTAEVEVLEVRDNTPLLPCTTVVEQSATVHVRALPTGYPDAA
jgi:acyl dehydratase